MVDTPDRADPRTIITPDAFSVAPELLGLPLAHPWRRAAAILVDLVLVAILANAQAVFFAFAAGLFVFWLALRRGPQRRVVTVARRAARVTIGCLGAVTLTVAGLAIWFTMIADPEEVLRMVEDAASDAPVSAAAVADVARRLPVEAAARGAFVDPDTLSLDGLAARYAAARAAGDSAAMSRLGPALGAALAADSLAELDETLARLEDRNTELERRLDDTADALDAERNRGILSSVYAVLDDVGLGLGWSGLYFTFFLGWWRGRTPGKRLLGIRVVRLDGRPLSFWVSFERFGGYAASLFTGLEGFGRLIWDPNRQALEDKLAGTVVIRDSDEARERVEALHRRTVPRA